MNYTVGMLDGPTVGAWLLAGGQSRRMGSDKALLPVKGQPLLVHTLAKLHTLTPSVHVLAPAERYAHLHISSIPDLRSGPTSSLGPLAGIETALSLTAFPWNWIVACDLPFLDVEWMARLQTIALSSPNGTSCVCPLSAEKGLHPLCALWHVSALPAVQTALDRDKLRVKDVIAALPSVFLPLEDPKMLANWNEPSDLDATP